MTIITGIIVFLLIILLLVSLLLFVKNKLTPSGNVKIVVNDDNVLDVGMGSTVLSTLQSNGIFLSSACGGSGSCGQCRCQVVEGGGEILPTEVEFFTRKQIKDHWRLGCQTKVKDNLNIRVPEEVFGVKAWECEVVSNNNVATFIKEFVVKLPDGEHLNFKPGSYIQIQVPDSDVVRAYSMANYPAEGDIVMLNVRIATPPIDRATGKPKEGIPPGICSSYIFSLNTGDKVHISGPYGDFHILDTKNEMLYIGGGAGMAPLRSQLLHLFHTLKTTDRKISYWYGARSKTEIFYEEDFRAIEKEFPNFSFHIALSEPLPEDNWTGYVGFIHQVIYDNYLVNHEAPEDIEYYMCGPGPMANSVKKMLNELGVPPEMLLFDDFG
ncbi:Na(+)-translocating NADH-quinone reductase subunit F [Bacteroidia bacterium]|nr:Na(+)-translocating NADH-quinone reductase subunit F [Bacteroidia bacterium]